MRYGLRGTPAGRNHRAVLTGSGSPRCRHRRLLPAPHPRGRPHESCPSDQSGNPDSRWQYPFRPAEPAGADRYRAGRSERGCSRSTGLLRVSVARAGDPHTAAGLAGWPETVAKVEAKIMSMLYSCSNLRCLWILHESAERPLTRATGRYLSSCACSVRSGCCGLYHLFAGKPYRR